MSFPAGTVVPLRNKWNAHAAIASAHEQIPIEGQVVVLWYDKDGVVNYRASGLTYKDMLWMGEYLRREATLK